MKTYFRCIFHGSICLIELEIVGETPVRYIVDPDTAVYAYGYEIPGRIIGNKIKKEDCYPTMRQGIIAVNKYIKNRMKSINREVNNYEDVCGCTKR